MKVSDGPHLLNELGAVGVAYLSRRIMPLRFYAINSALVRRSISTRNTTHLYDVVRVFVTKYLTTRYRHIVLLATYKGPYL